MTHSIRLLLLALVWAFSGSVLAAIGAAKDDFKFDLEALNRGIAPVTDHQVMKQKAEELFFTAVEVREELDSELMEAVHIYAMVVRLTEKKEQAKEKLKAAIDKLEDRFGKDTYSIALVLIILGEMKEGAEQVEIFQRVLAIQYRFYPDALMGYAMAARNMADVYIYQSGQFEHGLQMLGVAFPVFEHEFGPESEEVMWSHLAFGRVYAEFDNSSLTNASVNTALAIVESIDNPTLQADVSLNVGLSLSRLEDSVGASEHFERAIAGFETHLGVDTFLAVKSRMQYAQHLQTKREHANAVEQLEIALPFFDRVEGHKKLQFDVLKLLVEAHEDLGMRDKASEYCLAISHARGDKSFIDYQPVLKRAPTYPKLASGVDKTGYVIVEYTVDEKGIVQSPKIVESKGSEAFHAPSIEASHGFRYAPRIRDGKPVAVPGVRNKFTFKSF
ncbi:MAG: energy transducer TonB [Pseudomonadota bacterium]